MQWNITAGRPVYLQLVEQLELGLLTGAYPPGSRIPPVRELAAAAAVNPNTMQRALQELEGQGLLQAQRTAGRTVTADEAALDALRQERAASIAKDCWRQLQALGLSRAEAAELLRTVIAEAQAEPPEPEQATTEPEATEPPTTEQTEPEQAKTEKEEKENATDL